MTTYRYDHAPDPRVADNGLASCALCGRALTKVRVGNYLYPQGWYRHRQQRVSTSCARRGKVR